MLEGFGCKEYNAACFDIYENDCPLGHWYTRDIRFLAPYLRDMVDISYRSAQTEERSIPFFLKSLEKEFGVKILVAALTGSRVTGLDNELSDWDVSFIYARQSGCVQSEKELSRSIQRVYRGDVDLYGWEFEDALAQLKGGNPTLLEWLNSPKVYIQDEQAAARIHETENTSFNLKNAIAYYVKSICEFNERFLMNEGALKEFLYYLQGALSCLWIEKRETLPTMNYEELLDATVDDEVMRSKIQGLIELKKSGASADKLKVDSELIEYARQIVSDYSQDKSL